MYVPIFIVLAVILTRLLPLAGDNSGIALVANLTPLIALTLCGAAFFKHRWAMVLPLFAILVSDMILNARYGEPLLGAYSVATLAIYGLVAIGGLILRKRGKQLPVVLGATVGGVLGFYLVTNTISFVMEPLYPRSLGGWIQCMTVGLPGFAPTWVFLGKSLAGNVIFAAIFCYVFKASEASEPELAAVSSEDGDKSAVTS